MSALQPRRGNIGLDVAPEKMALVQKQLISNCNLLGKPVLITRVVDTMVTNPRPTRAEATGRVKQGWAWGVAQGNRIGRY